VRPAVLIFIVVLFSHTILLPGVGATHGCAPSTPPSVPGPLAAAPAIPAMVLLNEVLLNPQSRWNCSEQGTTFSNQDAWVELYNPQSQAFNLYVAHAYLDSGPTTNPYFFPFGASIAAHGYLVIFPRIDATFVLTETETLRLLIAGVTIDQVTVPELAGDQSYARVPDGGKWQVSNTPTIDASNGIQPVATSPATSTSTGSGGYGGQNGSSASATAPVVAGTQPAWASLTLPMATPTLAPTAAVSVSSSALPPPSTQVGDDQTIPRRVILTLLVLALALTVLWCWRLFSRQGDGSR